MDELELKHLMIYHQKKLSDFRPEKAVHYCNLDTFNKIVQPFVEGKTMDRYDDKKSIKYKVKYINFFATDLNYLNDREEYNIGTKHVESVAGPFNKSTNNEETFIACFCDKTDNLTQWKYYGKDAGLAVEFDTENVQINYCDKCTCPKTDDDKKEFPQKHDIRFMPFEVFYCSRLEDAGSSETKEIQKRIKSMLPNDDELASITEQTAKVGVVPYIKHIAFEDECESRIILYHIQHGKERCSSTNYRTGNIIKPFLNLRLFYGNRKAIKHIPIKSVTVGPCPEPRLLIRSIFHMLEENYELRERNIEDELDKKGFVKTSTGIIVTSSSAPFRSFQ